MKKTIFIAFVVLLLAGCTSVVEEPSTEGTPETGKADLSDYYTRFDKLMMGQVWPITEYDSKTASKEMISNTLSKIPKARKEAEALEKIAEQLGESEEFVSVNKEYFGLVKELLGIHEELYSYELDWAEYYSFDESENQFEELFLAISRCGCDDMDCDSFYENSVACQEKAAKKFREMGSEYSLKGVGGLADYLEGELEIVEEEVPDLMAKAKKYGDRDCYRISDPYMAFLGKLQELKEPAEEEIKSEASKKWFIPISNLIDEIDSLSVDFDRVRLEVSQ
ncbi:membrane lipoprotein lipid attachment site-containing protein [Candidatus Woesearchaeota archaeon]|nr:membrane lipoprotein lipid attachment site-containing protein [Candidatus Woesearchaeota archaeon]